MPVRVFDSQPRFAHAAKTVNRLRGDDGFNTSRVKLQSPLKFLECIVATLEQRAQRTVRQVARFVRTSSHLPAVA
jgi:hypothetical protein